MKRYKLNAIDSTNDYLKQLALDIVVENYSIVQTNYQHKGKGQMGNNWHSEKGKNLLFSILIRFESLEIKHQAYLNFAISNAIYTVLNQYLSDVKIKWPNDILSRQKKICGILIENTVKNGSIVQSIVGIGLNVNQMVFPTDLPNVTSLKSELNQNFNLTEILNEIVIAIKQQIDLIEQKSFIVIKASYEKELYRLGKPAMYKTKDGILFMGKIITVTANGFLQIELEDETLKEFAVKEIIFI